MHMQVAMQLDSRMLVRDDYEPVGANARRMAHVRFCRRHLAVAVAVGAAVAVLTRLMRRQHQATYPGSTPPQFRSLVERPYREYDSRAPGNLAMPERSDEYDGVEDKREFLIDVESDIVHIFAVGDWGAILPNHTTAACKFIWDCKAQILVADAMKKRAEWARPQYVLNVGDNFYFGGIPVSCNAPPSAARGQASMDFSAGWQRVYESLAAIPWISCLGNHDYGGWRGDQGWPQQIGYSFLNHNWIMPARYYTRKVQHKGFYIDYFVIDSNAFDAFPAEKNDSHNICGAWHNEVGANCSENGGMESVYVCKDWFWDSYHHQKVWMEKKVRDSTARWKIVITHWPCGYDGSYYRGLYEKYGLDLLVTGHRHQQELWWWGTQSTFIRKLKSRNDLGDCPCIVTGGGGGITSEYFIASDYGTDIQTYGFVDIMIAKDWMNVELIDYRGIAKGNYSVQPHEIRPNSVPNPSTTTTTTATTTTETTTTETTTTATTTTTTETTTTTSSSTETTTTKTTTGTWFPPMPTLPPMPTFHPWAPALAPTPPLWDTPAYNPQESSTWDWQHPGGEAEPAFQFKK